MTQFRKVTNPTRTSPPKKGYMQKAIQKNMKQISKVAPKRSHKRAK